MNNQLSNSYHKDQRFGQAGRSLARRLAAYLPTTVTRQILAESLVQPGEINWINAATLFADISGFTMMAEALAVDGPRGAETLNRRLLMTFTALINAIHDAGGAVSHFHGDAMMVYFTDADGQAAGRALGCARFMQSLMLTSYSEFDEASSSRAQTTFALTMRIGLGYGRCLETVVGDPDKVMEFVLAGTAVDEAVVAEGKAKAGQVVASQNILEMAHLPYSEPFRVVDEVPPVPRATSPIYWDSFSQTAVDSLLRIAPTFIPKTLVERLKNPNTQFVAEHRPATTLFLRFEGIDFNSNKSGGLLQEYYQWVWSIIEQYGSDNSRINRVLTGDKGSHLHIIFGAPIAPDAPEQAIRCALAIQRQRPEFITKQQIGLCAGRVFACAVGSQNRREYTTVGRVVNLSSRLTDLCEDGAVLIDEATAERVREIFVFDSIPNVTVKGVRDPVKLYIPLEEKTVAAQARSRLTQTQTIPFGRAEELAVLESYLEDGLQGKGEMIAMFGPYGSGQVPLLASAVHYWQLRQGRVVTGACQQHLSAENFTPWHTIWRSLFELADEMATIDVKTAVVDHLDYHWPEFDGDSSLFGELLGYPQIFSPFAQRMATDQRFAELFEYANQLLIKITKSRPLLIIIEDIHWSDAPSLQLLDTVAKIVAKLPVTFLMTYREMTEFEFFNENRERLYKKLHLADLPPERALKLVREKFKVDKLPQVFEQRLGIRDREGRFSPVNPLFLEESLKFMLSEGVLDTNRSRPGGNRLRIQETAMLNLQVPDHVYAILLSRLDQLSPYSRSLLQTAAVIGRSFDLNTLVVVSPSVNFEEAEAALAELIEIDIVEKDGYSTDQKYIFSHALAHDVVYQSIPYARRQKLHATIGDLIIQENDGEIEPHYSLLAYHFGQTDRHETGLMYALAAADQAASNYENEAASNFYRRAVYHLSLLNERTHWQTAVHVYLSRAKVYRLRGEFQRAVHSADDGLKLCSLYGSAAESLPIYNFLAEIRTYQARYAEALSLTDKVLNSPALNSSSPEIVQANLIAGMATAAMHQLDKALSYLDQAEEASIMRPGKSHLIAVWQNMGLLYWEQHRTDLALKTCRQAVGLAREYQIISHLGITLYKLSQIYLKMGSPRKLWPPLKRQSRMQKTSR